MKVKFKEDGYVNNKSEVISELQNNVSMKYYRDVEYEDIIEFLNNPEDETTFFALFRKFLNLKFLDDDLLEYINFKEKKNYTKFITIFVDEMWLNKSSNGVRLYQLVIKFACDNSFVLEEKNYTMNELKELVNKKILCPVINDRIELSSIDELTNIKVYQEKLDKFNYLYDLSAFNYLFCNCITSNVENYDDDEWNDYYDDEWNDHKNEKWNNNVEYYEFFIKKLKQVVDVDTLMLIARRKIIALYVDDLINYYDNGTSDGMLGYYADDIKKIKILVRKYNEYAQKKGLELISENEFDIFLEGCRDHSADMYLYLLSYNNFLYKYDLTYDEILKIKSECESNEEWMYCINDNHFNPQNFVDKLILSKKDENTALRCLIDFKNELSSLTKCKLLKVILNSDNKEVIDFVLEKGLVSESNVKKYINKRK